MQDESIGAFALLPMLMGTSLLALNSINPDNAIVATKLITQLPTVGLLTCCLTNITPKNVSIYASIAWGCSVELASRFHATALIYSTAATCFFSGILLAKALCELDDPSSKTTHSKKKMK